MISLACVSSLVEAKMPLPACATCVWTNRAYRSRERVDNTKTVIPTHAPLAHTPAENGRLYIKRALTRFACLANLIKRTL
jgi:hypothetical protein